MKREYQILVGGRWIETDRVLEVRNPYDGSTVATTYLGGEGELEEAASAATRAFEILKEYPSHKRASIIRAVADGIMSRADELARTISLEAGKPIADARAEVRRAANTFGIASEEARRQGGEVIPLDVNSGAEKRIGIVRRFPVGVVLGIAPFNFPLNLVAHKVAPAMACGCPIIVKPASKTPLTALLLGEIITGAGWPAGGVNMVPSSGADAERLLGDERVRKLTFTGSPEVGWRLKEKSGPRRVTLELGGNAGVIIHDDADLDFAVRRCTAGAFSYAGQVCIAVQRIYVHRSVFDPFRDRFVESVRALKLGDPLDETTQVGPMIDEGEAARTEEWVSEAVAGGAKVLTGGSRSGRLFEPTVLTSTTPGMKVCCREAFAPIVVLEPYDDFNAALEKVDESEYGLQAGIFTRDVKKIFQAFERLEVGGVVAGDVPTFRVDNMPYGGVKMSGFGREGVRYAIEEMTELRLLALNLA